MDIDFAYYINVHDLMNLDLPRPSPKTNPNFFEDSVEIPIILVASGEDV